MQNNKSEQATFGAGCFWCVEAVFQRLKGVSAVESGYTGGETVNPSYEDICRGTTGHAEVVRISFDPDIISYETLLTVLWHSHDPTTLNQQGADKGTQYRSVIYYHNDEQRIQAETSLAKTDASDLWTNPIVTEISPLEAYYPAEHYHQNYYNNNSSQGYCNFVIGPKLAKLEKDFAHLLT
ncbi:MAG: peptide-methionine (S)-S-oxide reductase MsrA [Calditrichia bacterium]